MNKKRVIVLIICCFLVTSVFIIKSRENIRSRDVEFVESDGIITEVIINSRFPYSKVELSEEMNNNEVIISVKTELSFSLSLNPKITIDEDKIYIFKLSDKDIVIDMGYLK